MNGFGWHLIPVVSPFVILATGLLILSLSRGAHNKNKAIPFAILYGFGVSVWLTSLIYISAVEDVMLTHRASFVASYILVIGALGLALTFPNNSLTLRSKALLFVDGLLCVAFSFLIFFTDKIIDGSNFYGQNPEPFGALGGLYLVIVGLHLPSTAAVFVYRYVKEVQSRLYFNYIVLGFMATIAVAGVTNLLLPLLGTTTLALGGPVASMLPFVAIVYALGITSINDFRFTLAQLIHVISRIFALLAFLLLGYLLDRSFGADAYSVTWMIIMVLVAAAGLTVLYLVGPGIERYVDAKVAYSGQSPESIRSKLVSGMSEEVELEKNVTFIVRFIKDAIGLRSVGIVLKGQDGSYRLGGDFDFSQQEAAQLYRWALSKAKSGHAGTLFQYSDMADDKQIHATFDKHGLKAVKLAGGNTDAKGFYAFGEKYTQEVFTRQDSVLLSMIAEIADLSLGRALFYDRIKTFNLTLQQKVDEATKKLRSTNERLRVLDQTKDDFISMASHQLRTPLTSVKGYVSMVLDGDGGKINETQRKLLTQSFLSSQRMVYLISDLLNVSRLKTGKFVIEPVETNLADVIEEEVEQLVETVKSRELELNYHKPEHFPALMMDETKIRQVLMNFIDNAIYYTPAGGHINVYLVDKPDSIEFTVVDDGIGVPKHEQHHLFSKFYRAKNAKSARPDGTGLGIFMAKKVIVAQGGAVIFKSAEGKGSTFGFTFPKAKLMPKSPAKVKQTA